MTEVHDRVCRELAQCQKNYDFLRAAHSRLQRTILEARDAELEQERGVRIGLENEIRHRQDCQAASDAEIDRLRQALNHMLTTYGGMQALTDERQKEFDAADADARAAQAPQPDTRYGGWGACDKCREMVKNGTEHVCKGEFREAKP